METVILKCATLAALGKSIALRRLLNLGWAREIETVFRRASVHIMYMTIMLQVLLKCKGTTQE